MNGPCGDGTGHCPAPRCWIAALEVPVHADGGRGEGVNRFRIGRLPGGAALCPLFCLVWCVPRRYELNGQAGRVYERCAACRP